MLLNQAVEERLITRAPYLLKVQWPELAQGRAERRAVNQGRDGPLGARSGRRTLWMSLGISDDSLAIVGPSAQSGRKTDISNCAQNQSRSLTEGTRC